MKKLVLTLLVLLAGIASAQETKYYYADWTNGAGGVGFAWADASADGYAEVKFASDFDLGNTRCEITWMKVDIEEWQKQPNTEQVKWKITKFVPESATIDETTVGKLEGQFIPKAGGTSGYDTILGGSTHPGYFDAYHDSIDYVFTGKIAIVFYLDKATKFMFDKAPSQYTGPIAGWDHSWFWIEATDIPTQPKWEIAGNSQIADIANNVKKRPLRIQFKVIPTTGINTPVSVLPGSSELYQNYPNPFNPTTAIKYRNNMDGNVKLSVYDSNGKFVKELVNSYQEAGENSVDFNASNLNSGVYYYTLETPTKKITNKMLLVK